MNIKKFFITIFRLVGICIAMVVSFVIATAIANPDATANAQPSGDAAQAGMALLVVSIVCANCKRYSEQAVCKWGIV